MFYLLKLAFRGPPLPRPRCCCFGENPRFSGNGKKELKICKYIIYTLSSFSFFFVVVAFVLSFFLRFSLKAQAY